VPIEDGYLAATVAGEGPPICILHGSQSNRFWADPLISYLPDYRCIVPDRRGEPDGDSTAPGPADGSEPSYPTLAADVHAVVRYVRAERPLVVGASWGAKIALVYGAAGYPCAGIVCLDGAAWNSGGALDEGLYGRIACPLRMVFALGALQEYPGWAYTPEAVAAFSARHPQIAISWLASGHDIARQKPQELAQIIRGFAKQLQSCF
jgi:pimeloyl-ACP methyl ester carboxylesterase